MDELRILWAALLAYVVAGSLSIIAVVLRKRPERIVLALMALGLVLQTISIAMRWNRLTGPTSPCSRF